MLPPAPVPPAPGVYPHTAPRTDNRAELLVHAALVRHLPPGWYAWHSLRIRTRDQLEGEGDFVLAIPDRGILVLEVKGGAMEKRGGVWFQSGRAMDKSPRDQAHGYAKKLRTKLEEGGAQSPWSAIATLFPETLFTQEPTQGDLGGALLGQQDLAYLGAALEAVAERLFVHAWAVRDTAWIGRLHELWCETWVPKLTLGARIRQRTTDLVPLDREQLATLDLVIHNPRFFVTGGPGTGKTLVASEMYRRLQGGGARPVLLCSTKALAVDLRAGGLADAWTVGELAAKLLEAAGVSMQGGAASSAWTTETWQLAPLQATMDAIPSGGAGYSAVVIDEAQDFTANDWELVKAIAGQGPLWGFGDEAQGFWDDRRIPSELFPASVSLRRRYRCPEPLALLADRYRPRGHGAPTPLDGSTTELTVVRIPSAGVLEERVANEIQKAMGAGARPEDIAVVSLAGQTRTQLGRSVKIGRFDVVRADDPRADGNVVADTFLRFKWLERPWVIVVELGQGEKKYETRMHVALTRATVGCVVVGTKEEIEKDSVLAGAYP